MNLPHELEKLRDEKCRKSGWYELGDQAPFDAGFTACFQALSEAAGEFPEQASHMASLDVSINTRRRYDLAFISGAKWMFEADRARIGLAERWREKYYDKVTELNAIEARLAESERHCSHYSTHCLKYESDIGALQDKLSAAVARVRELEGLDEVIRRLSSALVRIMTTRCAWQLSQEIAREALKGNDGDD